MIHISLYFEPRTSIPHLQGRRVIRWGLLSGVVKATPERPPKVTEVHEHVAKRNTNVRFTFLDITKLIKVIILLKDIELI